MQKILPKKRLNEFLINLMRDYEVIAPIKDKNTKFQVLSKDNIKNLYLKDITEVPVKDYLMPESETILEFKDNKYASREGKTRKRIIFGLRKCDLNSFLILDKVMYDKNYRNRRKNAILIGLYCEYPDKYCFCNSMELEDKYDLFFYPDKGDYYINIGSKLGEELVKSLGNSRKQVIKKLKNSKQLNNKDIQAEYKNKIWEEDAKKCLSCGACTVYCPTCNCFDFVEKQGINLNDAKKIRNQTSCQLQSFSRVAGGKIFRESRLARFKHFVFHKIVYFKNKYSKYMCVGCGRCLRVCPTHIDWVNTINRLK
ncbi:anaerobic sulfite reductase subunit A [archaeon BMS3Abin17]|nr:anaerobic sulfite reductase subunit A [archaeon BMS3Abin17]HDZ61309.1 hypothetical protein [Candidatus Pacearchaeota archaeon]